MVNHFVNRRVLDCQVIANTLHFNFKQVLIDEATQATEPETLLPIVQTGGQLTGGGAVDMGEVGR